MTTRQLWVRRIFAFAALWIPALAGAISMFVAPNSAVTSTLMLLGMSTPALAGIVLLCLPRRNVKWAAVRSVGYFAVGLAFLLNGLLVFLSLFNNLAGPPSSDTPNIGPVGVQWLVACAAIAAAERQRKAYRSALVQ